jgi:hypothetical protein
LDVSRIAADDVGFALNGQDDDRRIDHVLRVRFAEQRTGQVSRGLVERDNLAAPK